MIELVTITVKGRQNDIDSDPVVVVSKGTLRLENMKYYIEYSESVDAETQSCNIIENVIIAQEDKVVINRTGAINTIMEFETQKKNAVEYETQFGVISMDIITNTIGITKSERYISIDIEYIFEMNGEHVSSNSLTIEISR